MNQLDTTQNESGERERENVSNESGQLAEPLSNNETKSSLDISIQNLDDNNG